MHPKFYKFPGAVYRNADDGNGNQNPGGSGGSEPTEAEKAAAADAKAKADKEAADKAAEEAGKKAGAQPSDAEAKLLKEVMQKKEALVKTNADLAAAQARLAEFDGVDPAAIKKLLADQKAAEEAQLAAKGEFDTLKSRMADEHTKVTAGLNAQIAELQAKLAEKDRTVEELSIGARFGQSPFIKDELTLTPSKARTIYGAHFDTVDGEVVAYDKPRGAAGRSPLVDQLGNHVAFDEALRKIVDADPDKDSLLRSKVKPGAGSTSAATRNPAPAVKPTDALSKIAAGIGMLGLAPAKSM